MVLSWDTAYYRKNQQILPGWVAFHLYIPGMSLRGKQGSLFETII